MVAEGGLPFSWFSQRKSRQEVVVQREMREGGNER